MRRAIGLYLSGGVIAAGLVAVPHVTAPEIQVRAIQLTGGDDTALVMGPSGIPIPTPSYVANLTRLFLEPNGFTGTPHALPTPEGLYPVTGVKSLPFDTSAAQGQQILESAIQGQIADGHVSASNPLYVFGWSQSATVSSLAMPELAKELAKADVPNDDVHFVLVGDPSNPDGGMLSRFDVPIDGQAPSAPALGITFSGATPSDLFPTDVYTNEYDGFADFPRYPINLLSDLNAYLGILYQHLGYAGLTADQLKPVADGGQAIVLPDSSDLASYYMIPDHDLPLLEPLRLLPVIGQPLYDLLKPDMSILVNLGYGCIDNDWCQVTDAATPTTFGLLPSNLNWGDVLTALANGVPQGIEAAVKDLQDPANYQIPNLLADPASSPSLTSLVDSAYNVGLVDTAHPSLLELLKGLLGEFSGFPISEASLFSSSPTEIVNDISATLSADYSALLPVGDTVNTLLTTVPGVLAGFVSQQLADGDVTGAIGDPIAAGMGIIPFAAIFGAGAPVVVAAGGTLVNLIDLFTP